MSYQTLGKFLEGFDVSIGIVCLSFFAFIGLVAYDIWCVLYPEPTLNSTIVNEPTTFGVSFGKEMKNHARNLGKLFYEEGLKKYFIPFIWYGFQLLVNWLRSICPDFRPKAFIPTDDDNTKSHKNV